MSPPSGPTTSLPGFALPARACSISQGRAAPSAALSSTSQKQSGNSSRWPSPSAPRPTAPAPRFCPCCRTWADAAVACFEFCSVAHNSAPMESWYAPIAANSGFRALGQDPAAAGPRTYPAHTRRLRWPVDQASWINPHAVVHNSASTPFINKLRNWYCTLPRQSDSAHLAWHHLSFSGDGFIAVAAYALVTTGKKP